ncbi:hypothetical protein [Bordetella tumulicola]|uniref:hypothetical protein n=1 Tax=Bordetella tumulicola TaxID=1649133 RepID=UPI0039EFE62F
MPERIELASGFTVANYQNARDADDKDALAEFVKCRFNERYLIPAGVNALSDGAVHGFTMMAISCLLIETLQAFYEGMADTKGSSRDMFLRFFANKDLAEDLSAFNGNDWFYADIRCAILHQGEARNGWRIRRLGPLLDHDNRTINAHEFLNELRKSVNNYAGLIRRNGQQLANFHAKMDAIVKNCGPNDGERD